MAGACFINPASGHGTDVEELRRLFAGHRVALCDGEGFADQVREAVRDGADFVAVAGGDGTIRTAAEVLRGGDVPLVPVPAGTRNHFARDVGIDTLEAAVAATKGRTVRVDLGDVNGSSFVNNSSIGLYPKVVVRREVHQKRIPKWAANIVAGSEQLRHGRRFDVGVDGVMYRAWLVFVGNGRYGDGLLDLTDRDDLADGVLDIRIVRADRQFARIRVVGAVLAGRLLRSPLVVTLAARSTTITVAGDTTDVALDGEVRALSPPLRYECQPGALRILVP